VTGAEAALRGVDSPVVAVLRSARDVAEGVYEGGLKLWECCADLLSFLAALPPAAQPLRPGVRVLDLGTGAGVLAAVALRAGCDVVAQDLNAEVLALATGPNAVAAVAAADGDWAAAAAVAAARLRLVAGSWAAVAAAAQPPSSAVAGAFDVVLSSETLYRPATVPVLLDALAARLAPGGVALLATKRFYFGVGGGTRALLEALGVRAGEGGDAGAPSAGGLGVGVEAAVAPAAAVCAPAVAGAAPRWLGDGARGDVRLRAWRAWAAEDGVSNVREVLVVERLR
jgi:2-polyprenyl-3-methyl-5-hydroxy-6-metoxy-1,4-benzoquinol methylase